MKRDLDIRGAAIEATGLSKAYAGRQVLLDTDLRIAPGEFIAIVGRNGCGKSTLLRLLAGLEPVDSGRITLDGDAHSAHQSDIRIMFQDARLLPWKRVLDNVALGLRGPMPKSAPAKRWRKWAWPTAPTNGWRCSRVGNVSGWPWRAHWCTRRACCCWMSLWVRSTCSRAPKCTA